MSTPDTEPAQRDSDESCLLAASDGASRDFRDALGHFATGVTVVTARTAEGRPIGVTISSFNSVSLAPPLILWSLSSGSPSLTAFRSARHYAVNVLAAEQQWISECFAGRGNDGFAVVLTREGLSGAPLIEGCTASFECRHESQYPGGDHLIFLGLVQRFTCCTVGDPLIFHSGRYRRLRSDDG